MSKEEETTLLEGTAVEGVHEVDAEALGEAIDEQKDASKTLLGMDDEDDDDKKNSKKRKRTRNTVEVSDARRESHKIIEQKRRQKINEKINELRELLNYPDGSQNKAIVLQAAVENIKNLKVVCSKLLTHHRQLQDEYMYLLNENERLRKLAAPQQGATSPASQMDKDNRTNSGISKSPTGFPADIGRLPPSLQDLGMMYDDPSGNSLPMLSQFHLNSANSSGSNQGRGYNTQGGPSIAALQQAIAVVNNSPLNLGQFGNMNTPQGNMYNTNESIPQLQQNSPGGKGPEHINENESGSIPRLLFDAGR